MTARSHGHRSLQRRPEDARRRAGEIAQARYRVGLVDLLTVLTTENALFPAEDTLVQVRLTHMQALVSLFNALGGGWRIGTG
jgi:outer membrane protein, multidrug efflux system